MPVSGWERLLAAQAVFDTALALCWSASEPFASGRAWGSCSGSWQETDGTFIEGIEESLIKGQFPSVGMFEGTRDAKYLGISHSKKLLPHWPPT